MAGYFMAYIYPLSVVIGYGLGGAGMWLTQFMSLGVYPLFDARASSRGPELEENASRAEQLLYAACAWLYVPIQATLLIWSLHASQAADLRWYEVMGFLYSVALTTGTVGITAAHELIHRSNRVERVLGLVLLATVSYMPFRIYHVHGHHRHVATERDISTARLGESVYRFYLRSVTGTFRAAWVIETKRLRDHGLGIWSLSNRMLQYAMIQSSLYIGVAATMGFWGLAFFFVQGLLAIIVLETINYVQHYGLKRAEIGPGRYEKVSEMHSWNSPHLLTNLLLFNLGRHSDHHVAGRLRFAELRIGQGAPKLPAGYFAMAFVALIPGLWRRIMDPRVEAVRKNAVEQSAARRGAA